MAAKVSFQGPAKTITVLGGVTDLDIRADVYSEWVRWTALSDNSKYPYAMRFTGRDVIPGSYTGDTYFLINGWRLLIDFTLTKVVGVLYSDDYATAYFTPALVPLYPATVSALVLTTNAPTAVETAAAVRSELAPELSAVLIAKKILNNRTETNPVTGMLDIYNDDGVTVWVSVPIHEDVAGTQPYRGQGIERRGAIT